MLDLGQRPAKRSHPLTLSRQRLLRIDAADVTEAFALASAQVASIGEAERHPVTGCLDHQPRTVAYPRHLKSRASRTQLPPDHPTKQAWTPGRLDLPMRCRRELDVIAGRSPLFTG